MIKCCLYGCRWWGGYAWALFSRERFFIKSGLEIIATSCYKFAWNTVTVLPTFDMYVFLTTKFKFRSGWRGRNELTFGCHLWFNGVCERLLAYHHLKHELFLFQLISHNCSQVFLSFGLLRLWNLIFFSNNKLKFTLHLPSQ